MKNCWEYKKCGREPGGENVRHLGVCPASVDTAADGINRGVNGGRLCWAIEGTLCNGEIMGAFLEKHTLCQNCEFYEMVLAEEDRATLRILRPASPLFVLS